MTGELAELLRRCHRAEIEPLAHILGVRVDGVGLRDVAERCERVLRVRGSNQLLSTLFRNSAGPPYGEMVDDIVRYLGLPAARDTEAAERAVAEHTVRSSLAGLTPEGRAALLTSKAIDPSLDDSEAARALFRAMPMVPRDDVLALGPRHALVGALLFVLPCLMPVFVLLSLVWLARPRYDVVVAAVVEVASLRQRVRHRVTVGIVGSPSSGKDAALNAIFGIDTGNINPVAGSTKQAEITQLPGSTALYTVNTPGLGDVVEAVTEEARQVIALIDVFIYVLNAQGGVQTREKTDYDACVATGRPVLIVVNKIDTLREEDRERYVADARVKLQAPAADFRVTAFDPLPQLMDAPLGVDEVRAWLEARLGEMGKDLDELPWRAAPDRSG